MKVHFGFLYTHAIVGIAETGCYIPLITKRPVEYEFKGLMDWKTLAKHAAIF